MSCLSKGSRCRSSSSFLSSNQLSIGMPLSIYGEIDRSIDRHGHNHKNTPDNRTDRRWYFEPNIALMDRDGKSFIRRRYGRSHLTSSRGDHSTSISMPCELALSVCVYAKEGRSQLTAWFTSPLLASVYFVLWSWGAETESQNGVSCRCLA